MKQTDNSSKEDCQPILKKYTKYIGKKDNINDVDSRSNTKSKIGNIRIMKTNSISKSTGRT